MRRRIVLVLCTLVGLLAAFGVYSFFAGGEISPREEVSPAPRVGVATQPAETIEEAQEGQKWLFSVIRDDEGNIRRTYKAPDWEKREDGSYLLISPEVQSFEENGQSLTIRAERGTVVAEQIGRSINIRSGTLEGDVCVFYDQAPAPHRLPPDQRPEDLIRIHVDDLVFSNDLLEIRTSSNVTLFSQDVDVYGKGLT
ncbi:MAG: hypothetical protein ACYSTL_03965, partial [Planctomycetota bacterium]